MSEPVISPEALADLDEAWDSLSRRNVTAADRDEYHFDIPNISIYDINNPALSYI